MKHDKLVKKVTNLVGQKFGRLTVIGPYSIRVNGKHRATYWLCRCDCGAEKEVWAGALTKGNSKSCGCLSVEVTRKRSTTHGCSVGGKVTREYEAWRGMKDRCYNPNEEHYDLYGGRGITVCDRWRDDFSTFLSDMGPCLPPNTSIDRIDTNGDYEPGNCRWATQKTQCRNQRRNHLIEYRGVSKPLTVWAEEFGLSSGRLYYLIVTRGHSIADVVASNYGEGLREVSKYSRR